VWRDLKPATGLNDESFNTVGDGYPKLVPDQGTRRRWPARLTILKHRRSKPWPSVHAMRTLVDPTLHAAARPCGPARKNGEELSFRQSWLSKPRRTGECSVWPLIVWHRRPRRCLLSERSHSRGASTPSRAKPARAGDPGLCHTCMASAIHPFFALSTERLFIESLSGC
jgi:hypothetical protein